MKPFPPIFSTLPLISMLFLTCSRDPVLIFPDTPANGITVSGFVKPEHAVGTVYLLQDTPVDSCTIDSATGYFTFSNVVRGSYLLQVKAQGWGVYEQVVAVSSQQNYQITLSRLPAQIKQVGVEDSTVIGWYSCTPDTLRERYHSKMLSDNDTTVTFSITFSEKMDEPALRHALSLEPALAAGVRYTYSPVVNELSVTVRTVDLFRCTTLVLSLDTSAATVYARPLDFTLRLHYLIANDCFNRAVFTDMVRQTTPENGATNVDPLTDAFIYFRTGVIQPSIEGAISVAPAEPFNLLWMSSTAGGALLRVAFPGGLSPDTRYRITIDSTARTADSLPITATASFSFTTASFRVQSSVPYNRQNTFSVDSPFVFTFNVPVDSASFVRAFSVEPPLSTPVFTVTDSGRKITVHHGWLEANRSGSITIDTLCTTARGTALRSPQRIEFTTGSYPSLVYSIIPSDTLIRVSSRTAIIFRFSTLMDPSSLDSRITVTPPVQFSTGWETDTAQQMILTPLQELRCATRYTVTIDSGYTTAQGIAGDTLRTSFTTEPLSVTGFRPLDGQINTPLNTPLHLQFNAPVDTTGLAQHISSVPSLDSVTVTVVDSSGCSAFMVSHHDFDADTVYTVTIGTGVTDRYGSPLAKPFSFSFTTVHP